MRIQATPAPTEKTAKSNLKFLFKDVVQKKARLVHLTDEVVDELLSVTDITTFDKVEELALSVTAVGRAEVEWPQEVGDLLEVWASGCDFVNTIFNGENIVLAKFLLDDRVVLERNTLLVDLTVTTLVDQFTDGLEVWFTVGDVWLDHLEHLLGGSVDLDEDTRVDLEKTEELHDLTWLWSNVGNTTKTDGKVDLCLRLNVEVSVCTSDTLKTHFLSFSDSVLLDVLLSTLEDDLTLSLLSLRKRGLRCVR